MKTTYLRKAVFCAVCLLAVLVSVVCLSVSAATASYKIGHDDYVMDPEGMLTASEKEQITQAIINAEKGRDVSIRILIRSGTYGNLYYGDDYLKDSPFSSNDNLIIWIVQLDARTFYYNLYTYGDAYSRVTDREVDVLLDDKTVHDNIKGGNLAPGLIRAAELSGKAFAKSIGVNWFKVIIISTLIGLLVALLACRGVVRAYKMKTKQVIYPFKDFTNLELTEASEEYIGTTTTRVRISSSRSRGFGGGGGGNGHGGGSGSRGGR